MSSIQKHHNYYEETTVKETLRKYCLTFFLLFSPYFALFLISFSANAQLTQNLTIGNPKALGLAHAVTADPPGIDSIHFNPAGLAKIKGREYIIKVIGSSMTLETEFGSRHLDKAQTAPGQSTVDETYVDVYCGGVETPTCHYPDDPLVENQSSSTSKPLLMLPGRGLTEVPFLAAPVAGIAIADPDYNWTYGTAIYTPLAFGYDRGENDPAQFQGQKLAMSRITYFAPSIGVQINEQLSIGASIGFSWQGFGLKTALRMAEPTLAFATATINELNNAANSELIPPLISPYTKAATLSLEVDDPLSLTFNLGFLWKATEWLTFGAAYQSEGSTEMEGDYKAVHTKTFSEGSLWLGQFNALLAPLAGAGLNGEQVVEGTANLALSSPAHFSMGASLWLFPDLKVNVDIKWTDYRSWDAIDIYFDKDIDFLTQTSLGYTLSLGYGDDDNVDPRKFSIKREQGAAWTWAIGFEYQFNDAVVFRAGYEPRGSVTPDDRLDLLAPLAEAYLYTLGFGVKWDAFSRFDAAIAYLSSSFSSGAGESQSLNSTIPGQFGYNPYAYQDVSATTTAYIFSLAYEEKF